MNNSTIVTGVFLLLLVFLANPFDWWMPTTLEYLAVAALAVVAALFAGLLLGEKARDEREVEIRARAARAGYLAGVFVLTLGSALTILMGKHADPWLLSALGVMILTRLIVRKRSE